MGNDNKMIIHKPELKLFLSDSMYPETKTEAAFYDLDCEYEKTKQNKNHFVFLMLTALVILVIGITYGITSFIEYQNRKADVEINVFADANLMELFDMVSRTEDALASTLAEKAGTEILRQTELEEIEARKEGALHGLQNMRLSKAAQKEREKEILLQFEKDYATAKEYYDAELVVLEKAIDEHRKQLESLDSSRVKQAQEQQVALDFQRHIYDMEKAQLQTKHEATVQELREKLEQQQRVSHERQREVVDEISQEYRKFIALLDPIIEDKQIEEIKKEIAEYIDETRYEAKDFKLDEENEYYNSLLDQIEHAYDSLDYLAQYLAGIPQENSLPSILETIESIYYVIGIELSSFSSSEISKLQKTIKDNLSEYKEERSRLLEAHEEELVTQRAYYESLLEGEKEEF